MKHLILALLVAAFSLPATAGITIQCKPLGASGDPLKGLNVSKGGTRPNPGGKLCEDDGERHVAPPTAPTADPKPLNPTPLVAPTRAPTIDTKQQQKTEASLGGPDTISRGIVKAKSNITNNKIISDGKGKMPPYGKSGIAVGDADSSPNELTMPKK